jgi:hypothetical protein
MMREASVAPGAVPAPPQVGVLVLPGGARPRRDAPLPVPAGEDLAVGARAALRPFAVKVVLLTRRARLGGGGGQLQQQNGDDNTDAKPGPSGGNGVAGGAFAVPAGMARRPAGRHGR